ncbi:Eukaryotic translation initiation factor SUI1 [Metarhizium rileyi]|uniref:Eukaryotic translation initiation factor SUI1 n=2 Tax=Metarhizium rileyi (strain RCEF 4871) TaxID=1649241 RepID=A0A162JIY2_METRR|nr:Eukaryotic translation initiation factor SUI1 [Metarhizium rileyi RCEF 4871]
MSGIITSHSPSPRRLWGVLAAFGCVWLAGRRYFPLYSVPLQLADNAHSNGPSPRAPPLVLLAHALGHQKGCSFPFLAPHLITTNPAPLSQTLFHPSTSEFMSIENLKTFDPFAEADEDTGENKQSQNYIHIRIQQRNGRKTLTTVQGLPKKFDQKKILKVIKKKFACNGTIVNDTEMGEVIQLQGDQRKDVQEFLIDKKDGLELDAKTIKVHGF